MCFLTCSLNTRMARPMKRAIGLSKKLIDADQTDQIHQPIDWQWMLVGVCWSPAWHVFSWGGTTISFLQTGPSFLLSSDLMATSPVLRFFWIMEEEPGESTDRFAFGVSFSSVNNSGENSGSLQTSTKDQLTDYLTSEFYFESLYFWQKKSIKSTTSLS